MPALNPLFLYLALGAQAGGITDHPRWQAKEALLSSRPLGQVRPEPAALRARSADTDTDDEVRKPKSWLLSSEGVPCQLPFWHQGKRFEGCHPEGWCCLDGQCAHRGACASAEKRQLPLQLPQDQPTTSCSLEALGGSFEWQPHAAGNTVFLLSGEGWADEELQPVVELSQDLDIEVVLLSYKLTSEEVREVMVQTQDQLRRLAANVSAPRAEQSFFLALTPAWLLSHESCWLTSVTHAWSAPQPRLWASWGEDSLATALKGTRGDWGEASVEGLEFPLRAAGSSLCDDSAPDLAGTMALVPRGECSFYHKARRAKELGAQAVAIYSQDEQAIEMGCAAPDPCGESLDLAVVMTTRSVGEALEEAANSSKAVTVRLGSELVGPSFVGVVPGGGLWAAASGAAEEIKGMEYRRKVLQQKQEMTHAAEDVLRVEVFQESVATRGSHGFLGCRAGAAGQGQGLQRAGGGTGAGVQRSLGCENCPPWDHELNLYLCIEGISSKPNCHDRRTSVGRWVTPYGREGHWLSNASAAIPLLTSVKALEGLSTLHLHTWQHYSVSLVFWFKRPSQLVPMSQMSLWVGGPFNLGYNPSRPPVTFDRPAFAEKVVLSTLITGHGWGVDEANCAEFCDHTHHFAVNGDWNEALSRSHPGAGTSDGCKAKVLQGVVPNQFGTWPFGRAGWCPGQHVDWWDVDVTSWLKSGENTIAYHAFFNGTDYQPEPSSDGNSLGFDAEIHLASVLTFYGSAREEGVHLLDASPPILLP
ncbi:unnamed protein product [Effrenium voratum]|nr:unnamed protein product [Effrenium voratum]